MGVRYFNGSRESGKRSPAGELMRLELQKKGKLPAVERYKFLLNQKLMEAKKQSMLAPKPGRVMSKRAEEALKQIAMKKAAKQQKIMRRMVVVQPKNWYNGSIDKKGKIHDVAGNYVGRVNTKNGKINFFAGFEGGKYKARSSATELFIQESINKYSPYFVNLRKMQQMQQGMYPLIGSPLDDHQQEVLNLHGRTAVPQQVEITNVFGTHLDGHMRQGGGGVTSLGVMSDNVWGGFADNAWGTAVDNVWGGTESNVWGGLGAGGLWGYKGVRIFGTGNGVNYLAKVAKAAAAIFGLNIKFGKGKDGSSGQGRNAGPRTAGGGPRTSGGTAGARTSGRSR